MTVMLEALTPASKKDVATVAPTTKRPRGRPAHTHDNRFVKAWLWRWCSIRQAHYGEHLTLLEHDRPTLQILPPFVDDVLTGVARLAPPGFTGRPANRGTILKALLALSEITTKNVETFLNHSLAHEYSAAHVKRYTLKITEASKAIDYHLEKREITNDA